MRGKVCNIVSVFLVVGVYLVSILPGDVGRPEPGAHILHTLTRQIRHRRVNNVLNASPKKIYFSLANSESQLSLNCVFSVARQHFSSLYKGTISTFWTGIKYFCHLIDCKVFITFLSKSKQSTTQKSVSYY